jgi:hypothetical protein
MYGRAWLSSEGSRFEAPFRSIMVVGKEKPALKLGE